MHFFKSQFFKSQYCPLISVWCNRYLNCKINRSHERCLRVIYSDKSNFDELHDKDESIPTNYQDIQKLGIKTKQKLMVKTFKQGMKFFSDQDSYEVRQRSCSHIPLVNTISSGTENIQFLGIKYCELVPNDIKYLEYLKDFRTAIKKWRPCRVMPM